MSPRWYDMGPTKLTETQKFSVPVETFKPPGGIWRYHGWVGGWRGEQVSKTPGAALGTLSMKGHVIQGTPKQSTIFGNMS